MLLLSCRLVLAQNKKELLTNWWNEGKLEASEDLGDMVSAAGGSLTCFCGATPFCEPCFVKARAALGVLKADGKATHLRDASYVGLHTDASSGQIDPGLMLYACCSHAQVTRTWR